MRNVNKSISDKNTNKKKPRAIYIIAGILVVAVIGIFVIKGFSGPDSSAGTSAAQKTADLKITKSQIMTTATFVPYQSGNTKMEIVAVKAPDGTIRTAFNTCQVCYNSGKGYYVQKGDTLVCQNCGNVFKISQVEKEKNGCNPVPILEGDKTDDGQTITIPASFLNQNSSLFLKWKK